MVLLFNQNINDLTTIQRSSFFNFLITGINKELKNCPNPFLIKLIKKNNNILLNYLYLIFLYSNLFKIEGPFYSINECLNKSKTYGINLFLTGEYSIINNIKDFYYQNFKNILTIKTDIFCGQMPIMTNDGTFIINGCEKIIINQIIRSPGIYFTKEIKNLSNINYIATIISINGFWTKFILNTSNQNLFTDYLTIQFTDPNLVLTLNSNISLLDFFSYLGLSINELNNYTNNNLYFFSLLYKSSFFSLKESNINLIYNKIYIKKELKYLYNLCFNIFNGYFLIDTIGRYNINKKLNLQLPKTCIFLTSYDLIEIINKLILLKKNNNLFDDIDDLKHKQIRSIGDFLQSQLKISFYIFYKNLYNTFNINLNLTNQLKKINQQKKIKKIYKFYTINFLNNELFNNQILTIAFKEFFNTNELTQFLDQINPLAELVQKRHISVFGPNGLIRNQIQSVIRDLHPSQYGRLCPIETPEGQNAGLISSLALFGKINYLGLIETPFFLITNNKLLFNKSFIYLNAIQELNQKIGFYDITINNTSFKKLLFSNKENTIFSSLTLFKLNYLSISPLQLVSISVTLIPFFEHNDANRSLMGANMQRQAVPLLYSQKAIVGTGFEHISILTSGLIIKTYSEGNVITSSSLIIKIKDNNNQIITYYLNKYKRLNQKTTLNNIPIVWNGEFVFSNQIIADGSSTNDGELAVGKNLLLAYLPWEGFNYEDAIIINEKLILNDTLTSIHIIEYENTIILNSSEQLLTNFNKHLLLSNYTNLNEFGIIKIGSYVKKNDILIGKLTENTNFNSGFNKLLTTLNLNLVSKYIDTSIKIDDNIKGRVINILVLSNEQFTKNNKIIIKIFIATINKIKLGDKLAGRHGNKGVIAKILKNEDMPFLINGKTIDIIFNPLGVPSRMNIGQLFECLLGFVGENLKKRFKIHPFDEMYGSDASRKLITQKLKQTAIYNNNSLFYNSLYPGKVLLIDGRTGEFFDNSITIGKSYILKLIHLVEHKIHSRTNGPYALINQQPLHGKSHNGGQRFGEMEVWALEAYGCSYTLQELLTVKSDDISGREDLYNSFIPNLNIKKPIPNLPESFLVLISELSALGFDFLFNKFQNIFTKLTKSTSINQNLFKLIEYKLNLKNIKSFLK